MYRYIRKPNKCTRRHPHIMMPDIGKVTSQWGHYYNRGVDVYKKEGIQPFISKGLSFSSLIAQKQYWDIRYGPGTSILDRDWDNLLIFDACRYDYFRQVAPYDKEIIDSRRTVGSSTKEFLINTFTDKEVYDTVYITANPKYIKLSDIIEGPNPVFHDLVPVIDEWDPEIGTVPPGSVAECARDCQARYPNKRLLIHFIQPHYPFIGPTASRIREHTGKNIGGSVPMESKKDDFDLDKHSRFNSYTDAIEAGISRQKIRTAYAESIAEVIKSTKSLINDLPGKTVITADHGEHLGDKPIPFGGRLWGHPPGVRSDALCVVPWVEFESDSRKQITAEPPQEQPSVDNEVVEQRLRSLGYK